MGYHRRDRKMARYMAGIMVLQCLVIPVIPYHTQYQTSSRYYKLHSNYETKFTQQRNWILVGEMMFFTKWKSMSDSDIFRPFIFNMNGDYAEPQTKSIETKASVTNTKIFLFRSSWTFEHRPDRSHLNESTLIHKYTDISTFDSSFHMYDIGLILEVCPSNDLCPSNHLTR